MKANVSIDAGQLTVMIIDDGVGLHQPSRNSGLRNLQERAERRGGSLAFEDRPEGGLRLVWSIPVAD